MKGVIRFSKMGKLSARYIGPYKIIQRIGQLAYELELPQEISTVHPVFHVLMIRKCVGDPSSLFLLKMYRLQEISLMKKYPLLFWIELGS
ncbi:hypothetical protein MTR67_047994 [Solanum verrucosum]|uniref:Tf2-1-like SH3-like domain-containing protein n=1 Tax=Solanum verrucosum TaxID=315347 RepID=A0AAF0UZJ6_SOLVR|nr:hypothetical protein MTR67_047994 [Solanum verrucosum]